MRNILVVIFISKMFQVTSKSKLQTKLLICYVYYWLTINKSYNLYYFPCSCYISPIFQLEFHLRKHFPWSSIELGHWKKDEIYMCESAPPRLLALPFVSFFLSIKTVKILIHNTFSWTLPDFALLIFDLLCNQLVRNKRRQWWHSVTW